MEDENPLFLQRKAPGSPQRSPMPGFASSRRMKSPRAAIKSSSADKDDEDRESELQTISVENPMFEKRKKDSRPESHMNRAATGSDAETFFAPKPPKESKRKEAAKDVTAVVFAPHPPSKNIENKGESVHGSSVDDGEDGEVLKREKDIDRINALPFKQRIWEKKIIQRLVVAALAISLLWSTSLALVKIVIEEKFFPKPGFGQMATGFITLFDVTDVQRNAYKDCATINYNNCDNQYTVLRGIELSRVLNNTNSNENDLSLYENVRFNSKALLNISLNRMIDIVDSGIILAQFFELGQDCPRVRNWVEGQISAAAAEGTLGEFTENTTEAIDSLIEQLRKRQLYDEEYLANKTREINEFANTLSNFYQNGSLGAVGDMAKAYSDYRNCISGTTCGSSQSLVGLFGSNLDTMNGGVDTLGQNYAEMEAKMNEFFNDYKSLYDFANSVNDKLPPSLQIFPSGGATADTEPSLSLEDYFLEQTGLQDVKDLADHFLENAQQSVDATQDIASDAASQFEQDADGFYGSFDASTNYNPPPVNENPRAAWIEYSNGGQANFSDILKAFDTTGSDSADDSFTLPSERNTNFPSSPEEIVGLIPERPFSFYAYADNIFDEFDANLSLLSNVLVWADVAYRVIHSLYLINKYWNLSAIGKPPGDARLEEFSGRNWGLKASAQEKMAKRLTHPAVISVVSIIFLGFLSDAFWRLYNPFYYEYQDGCVEHDYKDIDNNISNGTMIYRNLFTITNNYAVQKGDDIQTGAVNQLNVQREVECDNFFQSSRESYENQLRKYFAIKNDYTNTLEFRGEILTCLDLEGMDAAAQLRFSDTFSVAETLNNAVFEVSMVDLKDGLYNCSSIPSCEFNCPDPQEAVLKRSTHETSCTAEYWAHASILASLMVVLTFVLTNWFRMEFMKAIVRIWWRHLNPYDFNFLGSCTAEGRHIDPEQVTKEGDSFRKAIRDSLDKALKKWERMGYFHIVFALSLNIPWIVAAVYLSKGLVYAPREF